jgi:hypothetical protein
MDRQKLKYDWSRLDINATTTFELLNQLCSTYASSAQKGYNYGKTRLEIKFGRDDDLTSFQDAVMDHLIDMGLTPSHTCQTPRMLCT